jgi:hypothetical protein
MDWAPLLTADEALVAETHARKLASYIRDKTTIDAALVGRGHQAGCPPADPTRQMSLAHGYAGLALACTQFDLCFPSENWDQVAHNYLQQSVDLIGEMRSPPIGLFSGSAGLGFAAALASKGNTRYQKLLSAVDAILKPKTLRLIDKLKSRGPGCPVGDFDLISGLVGVGIYLLHRRQNAAMTELLYKVVTALIWLSVSSEDLQRWHTPPEHLFPSFRDSSPYGNLNCGLAHGIPGVLAFLAIADLSGIESTGIKDAIVYLSQWTIDRRVDDEWGVNWPAAIPIENSALSESKTSSKSPVRKLQPSRSAWCYGSPGIASALMLASKVLGSSRLSDLAVDSLCAVYHRPASIRRIPSPGFCHGIAGLLQITLRFGNDTKRPIFAHAAHLLATELIAMYDPALAFGYRALEGPTECQQMPGLLEGMASIPLVLLGASTTIEPVWDRCFFISQII